MYATMVGFSVVDMTSGSPNLFHARRSALIGTEEAKDTYIALLSPAIATYKNLRRTLVDINEN
jgi:hypothetical protein